MKYTLPQITPRQQNAIDRTTWETVSSPQGKMLDFTYTMYQTLQDQFNVLYITMSTQKKEVDHLLK
jgi:hypothetical protein